jgi:hypothetical protein
VIRRNYFVSSSQDAVYHTNLHWAQRLNFGVASEHTYFFSAKPDVTRFLDGPALVPISVDVTSINDQ